MSYILGASSLRRLQGVHHDLSSVVRRAIELTAQDFSVIEGRRTPERQRELVAAGASKTLDSRHLTGHAVDLGAYVAGKIRWDWALYYPIAAAMREASRQLDVPVRWGGVWDRTLGELTGDLDDEVADYVARRRAAGQKAFIDGPHFELPRERYP